MIKTPLKIGLAGNPNSGKTSLFNELTGLNQKVGNFPGVTVEKVTGQARHRGKEYLFIDLPGAYSLYAKSEDEQVTSSCLLYASNPSRPDVVLYVADISQLKRNLLFFTQIADLKIPTVLVINKTDLSPVDEPLLAEFEKVFGVTCLAISTRKGIDAAKIYAAIENAAPCTRNFWITPPEYHQLIIESNPGRSIENIYAEYVKWLTAEGKQHKPQAVAAEIEARYQTIARLAGHLQKKMDAARHLDTSRRLDRVLSHKIFGPLIFLAILFIVFQSIFTLADYPVQWLETGFASIGEWLAGILSAGFLSTLVIKGILPGIAGVVVFLPQIVLLFLFLSVMEETGYMARVAFMTDKLMQSVGLNGKSVLPLLSGAACAIPAIMATRTIENRKERLITIMITPLISCSARLPVYILLISLIIPSGARVWIFDAQGLALMGIYLLGVIMAIIISLVFKVLLKNSGHSWFVMEMPHYQWPRWKNVFQNIYIKATSFVVQAGKIIVPVSVILWLLASFAPGNQMQAIEQKYANMTPDSTLTEQEIANRMEAEKLSVSYAGELGRFIEPAIKPLGYDWKIGIALVSSFAAREVFVGTMSVLYGLGSDVDDSAPLKEKMAADVNPATGKSVYSSAVAFSLMIFYAFALQCVSTMAVAYKETKRLKWPLIQFVYMAALAYGGSFIAYRLLS